MHIRLASHTPTLSINNELKQKAGRVTYAGGRRDVKNLGGYKTMRWTKYAPSYSLFCPHVPIPMASGGTACDATHIVRFGSKMFRKSARLHTLPLSGI